LLEKLIAVVLFFYFFPNCLLSLKFFNGGYLLRIYSTQSIIKNKVKNLFVIFSSTAG